MKTLSVPARLGLRAAAQLLSPSGSRASLVVLIYHRVLAQPDPLLPDEPDAALFAAHVDLLSALFNVLPLSDAVARLKNGSLPARAACITFDDGYINNLEVALPILRARQLPATVFISTGFIDGGRMWNDTVIESVRHSSDSLDLTALGLGRYELPDVAARRRAIDQLLKVLKYLAPPERLVKVAAIAEHVGAALPSRLMMSAEQIRALERGGMEIGAHTVNHPILKRVDLQIAKQEIADSKQRLEAIIGKPVTTFAYPNGRPGQDYEREHVNIVRDLGFSTAVSTAWGNARVDDDIFQIPRIAPWDRSALRYGARMIKSYLGAKAVAV